MKFNDEGYIVNVYSHGDNSAIVTIVSREYGKIVGYVKNALTKKNSSTYQIGNFVNFDAYSRVEENLLSLRVELISPFSVYFISDVNKLHVLSSLCLLCNKCLQEKERLGEFFCSIDNFFNSIHEDNWLVHYAFFEFYLLDFLGIGLDLSECSATGVKTNLEFVSPKSSKAVCLEAGLPYQDRLYKYPHFIINKDYNISLKEVSDLLSMTEFFLKKNYFIANGLKFPDKRAILRENVLQLKG